jgi:hypothetical protein
VRLFRILDIDKNRNKTALKSTIVITYSRFSRKKIIRIGSILSVQEVTHEIY